jgi:peptidyl-prolyl cis-trans isomerase SurA
MPARTARRALLALVVLIGAHTAGSARAADPLAVDAIVAVVDREIILASELEERALPYKMQVADTKPTAAATRAIYREVLEHMIDDAILRRLADDKRITVEAREIDNGIDSVAQHNKMTKEQIFEAAKALGMSERAYRDDVRRQIIEGKLFSLRATRMTTTLSGDEATRQKQLEVERVGWLKTLRAGVHIEIRFTP